MTKPQLHELLAVEGPLNKVAVEAIKEAKATLSKKEHLFTGIINVIEPLVEESTGRTDVLAQTEQKDVSETIEGKLSFVLKQFTKAFNVYAQKEQANQYAKADVKIGDQIIIKDAPATMLLGLESRLESIREMVSTISTTDPTQGWTATPNKGVWQARPQERAITKKVQREKVVFQPTETQPGQYTTYTEDVIVGKKITTHLSGLISSAEKSELLARVDALRNACKRARQRANKQEVNTSFRPGRDVVNYILNGKVVEDE